MTTIGEGSRANFDDLEREAWLKVSEQSLMETWDNPADDIFNELAADHSETRI